MAMNTQELKKGRGSLQSRSFCKSLQRQVRSERDYYCSTSTHQHTYVVVVCKIAWPHNILQFENKELMTTPKNGYIIPTSLLTLCRIQFSLVKIQH